MSLERIEGRSYGAFPLRTCREKVAELVAATGDSPDRWERTVPPSFAALALFSAAPALLADSDLDEQAASVIHGEQRFRWLGAWSPEGDYEVTGRIERVRLRGPVAFVTFGLEVAGPGGDRVVEGTSTFLMSGVQPPLEDTGDQPEPLPSARGANDTPLDLEPPNPGQALPSLQKSASRADLVRYAAATRDWNPIHWDHDAARAAGLPGVVCHGLLMAAWIMQAAARFRSHPVPLAEARFRFRAPLRPAVQAEVVGTAGEDGRLHLAITAEGVERVSATVQLSG